VEAVGRLCHRLEVYFELVVNFVHDVDQRVHAIHHRLVLRLQDPLLNFGESDYHGGELGNVALGFEGEVLAAN